MTTYTLPISQATLNALANTSGIGNTSTGAVVYPGNIVLTTSIPQTNPTEVFNSDVSANTYYDSVGNLRSVPVENKSSSYTLKSSDNGQCISITSGGVTCNANVMSAGHVVTIYNNSGSSQTITQGTGLTLQWSGQASSTTGNRTLGLYGMATILYVSSNNAVIAGSGLT
jgi:hypothetical protein